MTPKRIHVTGCSPRSGTTLITELIMCCFNVDQGADHEQSILKLPDRPYKIRCTKKLETLYLSGLLDVDPDLWLIFVLRDPRDVVVSRHKRDPGRYWSNLGLWRDNMQAIKRMEAHPRFILLRYEEIVADPDRIQDQLVQRMPFLEPKCRFSEFDRKARPSKKSLDALNGLRPITADSIGNWRSHKPRLLAQIRIHGSLTRELIELGYEADDAWMNELQDTTPDNQISRLPEHAPMKSRIKRVYRRWRYPQLHAGNLRKLRKMFHATDSQENPEIQQ